MRKFFLFIFIFCMNLVEGNESKISQINANSNLPTKNQTLRSSLQININKNKRICLVTGASSGIGEALAFEMIKKGWIVIGISRSLDKLNILTNKFPNSFFPIICDVSDEKAIKNISEILKAKSCYPELFFLNAGLAGEEASENPRKIETKHHHKMIAINYFGVLKWIEEWAEYLNSKEKPTTFVLTSSVNAFFSPPGGAAYSASKAAITKTFESLQRSYIDTFMKFVIIYPGPIATKGLKGTPPFTWSAEKLAKYMTTHALKNEEIMEPSFFYSITTRILNSLPNKMTVWILKKIS